MKLFESRPTINEGSALEKVRAHRAASTVVETYEYVPVPAPFAKEPIIVHTPFQYIDVEDNGFGAKALDALYTGASFISNKLFKGEFVSALISTTGRSYNYGKYLTDAQLAMRKRGFQLFINPKIAGDLNAFGRLYSREQMSGIEIGLMAEEFDKQFTPKMVGSIGPGIFTHLTGLEFDTITKKMYNANKYALWTATPVGGMRGGAGGAYWGVTQFGSPTYSWIRNLAVGWGVKMPTDFTQMTFGQMLVMAYVYAIYNQSKLIGYKVPVNNETLYVSHNQGVGVWQYANRRVPKAKWDKQSAKAKLVLLKHGFSRA